MPIEDVRRIDAKVDEENLFAAPTRSDVMQRSKIKRDEFRKKNASYFKRIEGFKVRDKVIVTNKDVAIIPPGFDCRGKVGNVFQIEKNIAIHKPIRVTFTNPTKTQVVATYWFAPEDLEKVN